MPQTEKQRKAALDAAGLSEAQRRAVTEGTGYSPAAATPSTSQSSPPSVPTPDPKTYTVKPGDTLSAVARQYGVSPSDITGYRSGDPNLIRPGETLTIGGATTQPEPVPDPRAVAGEVNQETKQIYENTKNRDIDIRESSRIIDDLAKSLATSNAAAPEAPDFTQVFAQERQRLGIEPLETELAEIDAAIERVQTESFVDQDRAGDRPISQTVLDRVRGGISKEAQRSLALLQVERSAVARQLDNKLTALQMTMDFTQQDYANASQQYTQEFNRSIQLIDLFSSIEDREEQREDRLSENARANLTTISNLLQKSGKSFADMSDSQRRAVREWELEAGLPEGTYEAFGNAQPKANILHTSTGTDAEGNEIVTFIYEGEDGRPGLTEVVRTGGVSGSSSGSAITLPDGQRRTLLAAGFTEGDINAIEGDVRTYGINAATEGMSDDQESAVREAFGGEQDRQFLNRAYFQNVFTEAQLKNAAKEAGFTSGGFLGFGVGDSGVSDYLDHLEGLIQQYRNAGYTDQDILDLMQ